MHRTNLNYISTFEASNLKDAHKGAVQDQTQKHNLLSVIVIEFPVVR